MDNEFGGDYISITDEDGNEFELELLDALIHDGTYYHAFIPAASSSAEDSEEEDTDIIILKSIMADGEELLSTLDSDDEMQQIYELFMERLFEDEDED